MKIRSQLILAFFLLAVLPLSGLVVYSYYSSRQAVEQTLAAEAWVMSAELQERLEDLRGDLERGMLQLAQLAEPGEEGGWIPRDKAKTLLEDLGDSAKLVEALEVLSIDDVMDLEIHDLASGEEGVVPGAEAPAEEMVALLQEHLAQLGEEQGVAGSEVMVHLAPEAVARSIAEAFEQQVEIFIVEDEPVPEVEAAAPEAPEPPTPDSPSLPPTPPGSPFALNPEITAIWRAAELRSEAGRLRLLEELRRQSEEKEKRLAESRESTRMIFGRELELPIRQGNAEVGRLRAQVRADALVQEVLSRTLREQGEIPFAVDPEGKLYTAGAEDTRQLEALPLELLSEEQSTLHDEHWVVATSEDSLSGLRFGIARPIDKDVATVRLAAARNFVMGLGLIVLAILGILPFSNRITRNLHLVTAGAERIAAGDLDARVPVRTRDEFGQLASTFNTMAQELSEHQQQLLEEERRRLLLATENDRKSRELEEARQLQLSLLPRALPTHPEFELAVHMRTATEVGGDYYDFQHTKDGCLAIAIGDATGHGLRAGTLVTALKSLFANYQPQGSPHQFLRNASATLRRLDLGRLAMAFTLVELRGDQLTIAAAGTPPLFIHRAAQDTVEEFSFPGLPLGTPLPFIYHSHQLQLFPRDTLLLTTDGFPELLDRKGNPLGYDAAREIFQEAVAMGGPQEMIQHLERALDRRTEGQRPADDVTFVVLQRPAEEANLPLVQG